MLDIPNILGFALFATKTTVIQNIVHPYGRRYLKLSKAAYSQIVHLDVHVVWYNLKAPAWIHAAQFLQSISHWILGSVSTTNSISTRIYVLIYIGRFNQRGLLDYFA